MPSSITRYYLDATDARVFLSIGPNQRVSINSNADLRIAYDEADLADERNYYWVGFNLPGTAQGNGSFIIEPHSAMDGQSALFIRTVSDATDVWVWIQEVA